MGKGLEAVRKVVKRENPRISRRVRKVIKREDSRPKKKFIGNLIEFKNTAQSVRNRFLSLFDNPFLSDFVITFINSEKKLFCHKIILAQHSEYFNKLFHGETKDRDCMECEEVEYDLLVILSPIAT